MSKRETPRQARARRDASWRLALKEGRVVRIPELMQLTAYPTIEKARAAVESALRAGMHAELVKNG